MGWVPADETSHDVVLTVVLIVVLAVGISFYEVVQREAQRGGLDLAPIPGVQVDTLVPPVVRLFVHHLLIHSKLHTLAHSHTYYIQIRKYVHIRTYSYIQNACNRHPDSHTLLMPYPSPGIKTSQ